MWSVLGAQRELEAQISVCFRVFEDIMIFDEKIFFKIFFREKNIRFLKKKSDFFRTSNIFFQLRNGKMSEKICFWKSEEKNTRNRCLL